MKTEEIKFRLWNTQEKTYVYLTLAEILKMEAIDDDLSLVDAQLGTNKTDKYGEDIYIGDIVEIKMKSEGKFIAEVRCEFGDIYFSVPVDSEWLDDWNLSDDCYRMEIIGNINEDRNLITNL